MKLDSIGIEVMTAIFYMNSERRFLRIPVFGYPRLRIASSLPYVDGGAIVTLKFVDTTFIFEGYGILEFKE